MANEKRLIDAYAFKVFLEDVRQCYLEEDTFSSNFAAELIETVQDNYLELAPTVDAVPVDDILLHHILIDENGIPEVKLQFGDRTLVLRREGDPVDAVEVVHGRWEKYQRFVICSNCDAGWPYYKNDTDRFRYCPNCGAKMDGGKR